MQSIKYLPASNQAANPSLITVQNVRTAGAADIIVNTVAGAPAFFFATMGTPHTFTDPVTSESITVISEASAVDFAGHLNSGKVTIDAIAPGYTDLGSKVGDIIILRPISAWADNIFNILNAGALNDDGTLKSTALDAFYKPTEITTGSFVSSGGIIAQTTLLTASFSDIVYYLAGFRYTKTGVANRVYTVSKDTYVDIDNTGTLTYTEVANGATTGFPLTAGRIRLAKVVTNGTTITSVTQYGVDALQTLLYPQRFDPVNSTHIRVYCNTTVSPAANGIVIPYDTKNFDTLNEWSTTNKKFTATKPGLYRFVARMWWGSAGAGTSESAEFSARLNGSTMVMWSERNAGNGSAAALLRPILNDEIYLNAGDTIDFINQSTNNVRDITASQTSTYVTIDRIA